MLRINLTPLKHSALLKFSTKFSHEINYVDFSFSSTAPDSPELLKRGMLQLIQVISQLKRRSKFSAPLNKMKPGKKGKVLCEYRI